MMTPADLDREGMKAAAFAQERWLAGDQWRGIYNAYLAEILFGAAEVIRRRQERDRRGLPRERWPRS